jgi:hypothetical protein
MNETIIGLKKKVGDSLQAALAQSNTEKEREREKLEKEHQRAVSK